MSIDMSPPLIIEQVATAERAAVSCGRCHHRVLMEAADLVQRIGRDATYVNAKFRLKCSKCGARGKDLDVRPHSLDVSEVGTTARYAREQGLVPARGLPTSPETPIAACLGRGWALLFCCDNCQGSWAYAIGPVISRIRQLVQGDEYQTPVGKVARFRETPCPACGQVRWRTSITQA